MTIKSDRFTGKGVKMEELIERDGVVMLITPERSQKVRVGLILFSLYGSERIGFTGDGCDGEWLVYDVANPESEELWLAEKFKKFDIKVSIGFNC
jgi:hypothetical protein